MWRPSSNQFPGLRRPLLVLGVLLVVSLALNPLVNSLTASAATITSRSLTIGSAIPSASTTNTYGFTIATAGAIQGLEFQACTTAIGACTAPSGMSFSSATFSSQTGWTQATNFAIDSTGANNCTPAANELCVKRTATGSESVGTRTIAFSAVTNPNGTSCSTNNCTFFVHITTYSANTYTTGSIVDTGTVAASTTQTLTVSATIQEALSFCVGNTTVDNATSTVPTCSTITGTSLNLGTLNSTDVSISPVPSTVNGDANNGLAELSTNASNGASVNYDAVQQSGTNHKGTLRVPGATCNSGAVNTDQCINAAGVSQSTMTAGTEDFGMTIAGINCSNVTAYTCTFSSGTYNLVRTANYDCAGTNTYPSSENGQKTGTTTCGYAWDETGTSETIASASTVVGNEAMILKFAATPNAVTPTGSYTAEADFVATPTF